MEIDAHSMFYYNYRACPYTRVTTWSDFRAKVRNGPKLPIII